MVYLQIDSQEGLISICSSPMQWRRQWIGIHRVGEGGKGEGGGHTSREKVGFKQRTQPTSWAGQCFEKSFC